jgi:hypothetical protein
LLITRRSQVQILPPLPTRQRRKARTTGPGLLLFKPLTCGYALKLVIEHMSLALSGLRRLTLYGGLRVVAGMVSDQFSDHGELMKAVWGHC